MNFDDALTNLRANLNATWFQHYDTILGDVASVIQQRSQSYDGETLVWERLDEPEKYITLIEMKLARIKSELAVSAKTGVQWNEDNAIDLIAYTIFLIAFKRLGGTEVSAEGKPLTSVTTFGYRSIHTKDIDADDPPDPPKPFVPGKQPHPYTGHWPADDSVIEAARQASVDTDAAKVEGNEGDEPSA